MENTPSNFQQISSPSKNLYKILFFASLGLFLAISSVLTTLLLTKNNSVPNQQSNTTAQKQTVSTISETTPTVVESDVRSEIPSDWKTYTDSKTNFSLKYPSSVLLNDASGKSTIVATYMNIDVDKIVNLESSPDSYNSDSALKLQKQLQSGDGDGAGFSTSHKIIAINNNINGVVSNIYGMYEICSVMAQRRLTFFIGDYIVDISYGLKGPFEKLIPAKYLTTDNENCGTAPVWADSANFDSDLSKDLVLEKTLQDWYDNFDLIIKSISIN